MVNGGSCWLCNILCACYICCRRSCCRSSTGLGFLAHRDSHEEFAVLCLSPNVR